MSENSSVDLGNSSFNFSDVTHSNRGNHSDYHGDYYYYYYYIPTESVTAIVLTIFMSIVFVGIVGNILVLIIIAAVKSMHTTMNLCLFSLAVSDILVLSFLPILPIADEIFDERVPLTKHLCYFASFYDRGAIMCSTLTFSFVTIDRFVAICYPMRSRRLWSGRRAFLVLLVIWLVSLSACYPFIQNVKYIVEIYQGVTYYTCYTDKSQTAIKRYDAFLAGIVHLILLPCFAFLYGKMIYHIRKSIPKSSSGSQESNVAGQRGRKQAVIMLFVVVVIFLCSYIPFGCLQVLNLYFPSVFSWWEFDQSTFTITWICRILVYVNSASNPIFYFSMSTHFRVGFTQVFCCRRKIGLPNQSNRTKGTSLRSSSNNTSEKT